MEYDKAIFAGGNVVSGSAYAVASAIYTWVALPWPTGEASSVPWHAHVRSALAITIGLTRTIVVMYLGRLSFVTNEAFIPATVGLMVLLAVTRLVLESGVHTRVLMATRTALSGGHAAGMGLAVALSLAAGLGLGSSFTPTDATGAVDTMMRGSLGMPLPLHPVCVDVSLGGTPFYDTAEAAAALPGPGCPDTRSLMRGMVLITITTLVAGAVVTGHTVFALTMAQSRSLSAALADANSTLQGANAGLESFLRFVSHEVRNPMSAAQLTMEAARLTVSREAVTRGDLLRVFDELQASLGAARAVLDDALDFQAMSFGQRAVGGGGGIAAHVTLRPGWHRLADVGDQARLAIGPGARVAGVGLTVRAPASLDALVDRRRVTQILLNLVSNAVKFTPSGRRVVAELALERGAAADDEARGPDAAGGAAGDDGQGVPGPGEAGAGGFLVVRVSDEGDGMTPEQASRLFKPFSTLGNTAASAAGRAMGSTGLGLTIVRGLCDAMGGTVEVRSAPGEGSTFVVRVPTRLRDTPARPAASDCSTECSAASEGIAVAAPEPGCGDAEGADALLLTAPALVAGSERPSSGSLEQRWTGVGDESAPSDATPTAGKRSKEQRDARRRARGRGNLSRGGGGGQGARRTGRQAWVVDDSAASRRAVGAVLRVAKGWEATDFEDGRQALDALGECGRGERPWPSVVLLDRQMPRMGGPAFLAASAGILRERAEAGAPVRVVAMTGDGGNKDDAAELSAAGAAVVLAKPLQAAQLLAAMA